MKNTRLLFMMMLFLVPSILVSQTIRQNLDTAYRQFELDPQLSHAVSSLYVINAKTGEVIFDKNSKVGLADASTQKIITASTAFELLGKDFSYKTEFGYQGDITNGTLNGDIYVTGNGDPTLGSPRFENTKGQSIDHLFIESLRRQKIKNWHGDLLGVTNQFESQKIPDGWIWQDIGNYYGAGSGSLNWQENQFDLVLKPGKKPGDSVRIIGTRPNISNNFINELKTASKGTGDNGYIYFSPGTKAYTVRGTEPCCVDSFVISGAVADNDYFGLQHFASVLAQNGFRGSSGPSHVYFLDSKPPSQTIFYLHRSPTLDSIIYWFLQKSINLYGEALIKTIAHERTGFGATDTGLNIVRDFWKQKGLDPDELNIKDGSGLSPQNRVTTHAQVQVLKYASQQSWFPFFFNALPEYNHMKMKSGSIGDVKAFCGYQTSRNGSQYVFSFLVNNFNGASSTIVGKMYKILDLLK